MVLKGVLQVKMLIKAERTDLILQGKYVGKIDTKDLLAHLGVCPQDYRAMSCYGHSKDPFFGSREDSGQVVQLRESQKSCVLTAAETSRFFFASMPMRCAFQIFCPHLCTIGCPISILEPNTEGVVLEVTLIIMLWRYYELSSSVSCPSHLLRCWGHPR